jgi:hypothetical protein
MKYFRQIYTVMCGLVNQPYVSCSEVIFGVEDVCIFPSNTSCFVSSTKPRSAVLWWTHVWDRESLATPCQTSFLLVRITLTTDSRKCIRPDDSEWMKSDVL